MKLLKKTELLRDYLTLAILPDNMLKLNQNPFAKYWLGMIDSIAYGTKKEKLDIFCIGDTTLGPLLSWIRGHYNKNFKQYKAQILEAKNLLLGKRPIFLANLVIETFKYKYLFLFLNNF